jgi:lipopolysaccharide biosynthesis regulator YciM
MYMYFLSCLIGKANLLLAKFSVDKSKFDVAQELCQRCLVNDNSCSQAWEILGLVKEKDMDYQHAAECYEKVSFLLCHDYAFYFQIFDIFSHALIDGSVFLRRKCRE